NFTSDQCSPPSLDTYAPPGPPANTPRLVVIFHVATGIRQPSTFAGTSVSDAANSGLSSEILHDIPPSRLTTTPRSVSAHTTNVRSFDATIPFTFEPINARLTSFHDFIPSRVIQARPDESLNHTTSGSSHANAIDVTLGFSHPSSAYGFPFHAYSLSSG